MWTDQTIFRITLVVAYSVPFAQKVREEDPSNLRFTLLSALVGLILLRIFFWLFDSRKRDDGARIANRSPSTSPPRNSIAAGEQKPRSGSANDPRESLNAGNPLDEGYVELSPRRPVSSADTIIASDTKFDLDPIAETGRDGELVEMLAVHLRESIIRETVTEEVVAAVESAMERHYSRAVRIIRIALRRNRSYLAHLDRIPPDAGYLRIRLLRILRAAGLHPDPSALPRVEKAIHNTGSVG